MNSKTLIILTALVSASISMVFTSSASAEESATRQMAQIVMNLNHHPSATDKEILRDISENGSDAEQAIANALLNMDHSVDSASKEKLKAISKDNAVDENTRELAKIVKSLNHKASSGDKKKLQSM